MKTRTKRALRVLLVGAIVGCAYLFSSGVSAQDAKSSLVQSYQELFDRSLKEKKGLNIYVNGQTIGAVFVKMIGNDAIEARNQTYGRIVIRLDRIDAVAIN